MFSSQTELLFWRVAVNRPTFKFLCIWYDAIFTDSQSSSGDVHVFMSSFSEKADAEISMSITRASACVVNETARLRHSHRDTQNMQDLYLNNLFVA